MSLSLRANLWGFTSVIRIGESFFDAAWYSSKSADSLGGGVDFQVGRLSPQAHIKREFSKSNGQHFKHQNYKGVIRKPIDSSNAYAKKEQDEYVDQKIFPLGLEMARNHQNATPDDVPAEFKGGCVPH
ncbi:hypothetical protein CEXT_223661 [Caerostris extrusa]|uniref:Uncharacterized protein n=1 Tax=Caerostris extrusa TaxID=172846 RepID=A0AAV4XUS7_CAEEX|nr:hypothetical protein CEXT_223661 [Caerostris extrusa]